MAFELWHPQRPRGPVVVRRNVATDGLGSVRAIWIWRPVPSQRSKSPLQLLGLERAGRSGSGRGDEPAAVGADEPRQIEDPAQVRRGAPDLEARASTGGRGARPVDEPDVGAIDEGEPREIEHDAGDPPSIPASAFSNVCSVAMSSSPRRVNTVSPGTALTSTVKCANVVRTALRPRRNTVPVPCSAPDMPMTSLPGPLERATPRAHLRTPPSPERHRPGGRVS